MKRHRTLIGALLGLMLLVQGFAVSAAPYAKVLESASAGINAMADSPCHGKMADHAGKRPSSCCNDNCPDMAACALGHIAAAAIVSIVLPQSAYEASIFAPVHAVTRTLTSPLRPPITLHG